MTLGWFASTITPNIFVSINSFIQPSSLWKMNFQFSKMNYFFKILRTQHKCFGYVVWFFLLCFSSNLGIFCTALFRVFEYLLSNLDFSNILFRSWDLFDAYFVNSKGHLSSHLLFWHQNEGKVLKGFPFDSFHALSRNFKHTDPKQTGVSIGTCSYKI